MQFRLNRRVTAVVAAAALGVSLAGGAAYAYWTAGGTATANITTGNVKPLVVTVSVASALTPSYPQAITGTVYNPNNFPVTIEKYTVALGDMPAGCSAGNFTITNGQVTGVAIPSYAGHTDPLPSGATIMLNDATWNQDACKGLTIPLVFTVN